MVKRQDIHHTLQSSAVLLFFLLFTLFSLSACLPNNMHTATIKPVLLPTRTPTHQPTLLTTQTPTSTATLSLHPLATPTMDCAVSGGKFQYSSFHSNILDTDFNYRVYLPPCYQTSSQQRFPVVYLLHGLSSTNEQWQRLGLKSTMDVLIANDTFPPFIIILPLEAVMEPPQTSRFPEALVEELIPWVDAHYNTLPEKAYRGIGGLSRGAAWAVQIGFENTHLFSSIGAHSLPLFKADGGKVSGWLTQEPPEYLPRVFIDIGRDDQEWKSAQSFANLLDEHHVPHEWYFFKFGHTETYWTSHLEHYLRWYAKDW